MTGPHSAWTLAFELSNPTSGPAGAPGDASSLALGRIENAGPGSARATVIHTEHVVPAAPRSTQDDLFPALDRLFKRAGIAPPDLRAGRIAVSVGPGGYTGLRVACAAAKVLADNVGARCVSVPTALVALRANDLQVSGTQKRAVALANKADSAWVYVEGDPDPTAPRFITTANAAAFLSDHPIAAIIADSFFPAQIRAACQAAGVPVIPPRLSAAACLEVAASLPDIDPVALLPIYAREPDAVTQWRSRHSADRQTNAS